jgi:Cft2 family RNA processing exonuclease
MQDKPIGAAHEGVTTAVQDVKDRARVLREVLDLYPETLTLDELVRELTIDSVEFEERDRVQRAVRDLIAGGLVHRVGDLVLPTRAAVNFQELSED